MVVMQGWQQVRRRFPFIDRIIRGLLRILLGLAFNQKRLTAQSQFVVLVDCNRMFGRMPDLGLLRLGT